MKVNSEEKDSSNKGFNGQGSSAEDYSLMQKSNDGGMLSSKE